jgi:tRNA (guanine-N7-)-methyltransferase
MDLEIGFGNGEYLARNSEQYPDRDFVGLEVAWNSVKRALRRLAKPPRSNARLILAPAFPALSLFFAPRSLSSAACLFPVPWPNDKHAHKRLFSRPFWDLAANRLKDEGVFRMVTDHEGLALWALEQARGSSLELTLSQSGESLDTKYDRKWRSGGQGVFFHLTGRKIGHVEFEHRGFSEMQPRLSYLIDPSNYRPEGQSSDPTIVFGDFIYDSSKRQGLLATKVVEDQFIQEFFIRVTQQPDGAFKLTPAFSSQVFPTYGISAALDLASLADPKPPKWAPAAESPEGRP